MISGELVHLWSRTLAAFSRRILKTLSGGMSVIVQINWYHFGKSSRVHNLRTAVNQKKTQIQLFVGCRFILKFNRIEYSDKVNLFYLKKLYFRREETLGPGFISKKSINLAK